ncbi:MAG: hypothetical protein RI917_769 [Actinomycetota bacterium]|jgi:dihydroorotate dehydrogenase
MYRLAFNIFFKRIDPELAHELGALVIRMAGWLPKSKPNSSVEIRGMHFTNRIGMAAGFDKNAKLVRGLFKLGFGHVEIGTVTPKPQAGNPKPRLFRIPSLRALINRMGFNNDGAQEIANRLRKLRNSTGLLPVIGVNIGKNKLTEPTQAAADYEFCAERLAPYADYLAVNVSSPNTPGLRDLQQIESLRPILTAVKNQSHGKPVLVKIAPDLSDEDAVAIARLVDELDLAGVIATNTTITRPQVDLPNLQEQGGLSGRPLADRSKEVLTLLRATLPKRIIVSVGGVETAEDVQERLELGADLVQGYTGFVYFGPSWPRLLTRV